MNDSRTPFGDRMDALATNATNEARLRHPATAARTNRAPKWGQLGWATAVVLLLVGGMAIWRYAGDDATPPDSVISANDGGPSGEADGPDVPGVAEPCRSDRVGDLLRSGLPSFDYNPAGSYRAAADNAQLVVTGTITMVQRTAPIAGGGLVTSHTELTVTDVVDLDGRPVPDVTVIAYQSGWADSAQPDPLAGAVAIEDLRFIGFLSPWSGIRSGYAPDVEGLYVACGVDTPSLAVMASAASPTEPLDPTLEQLAELLTLPVPDREDPVPPVTFGLEEAGYIRDAIVQLAKGELLAIEEIPLAPEISLALGSEVVVTTTNVALRDLGAWAIDLPGGYAGFAGPFSALDVLRNAEATAVTLGEHPHCAGDPLPPPPGVEGLVQISIQPAEGTLDSCIAWFAVDLFYDPDTGTITTINLALFGP